jgi:hypothetical protein
MGDRKEHQQRTKPLPLTNGHGYCITVSRERASLFVGEWPLHVQNRCKFVTFSLPKCLRNGRLASETAAQRCTAGCMHGGFRIGDCQLGDFFQKSPSGEKKRRSG